ncbi:hypothetical protein GWI34_12635 [Actinomadura sp. DSM 109109]|nr:hypothetical protein [Actinomadura lepetitiana]
MIAAAARRRPSEPFSGRSRLSAPIRTFDYGCSPFERRRRFRTVFGERPVHRPIARSETSGWDCTMRAAADLRSASDSGRPCETFSFTARMKASSAAGPQR